MLISFTLVVYQSGHCKVINYDKHCSPLIIRKLGTGSVIEIGLGVSGHCSGLKVFGIES